MFIGSVEGDYIRSKNLLAGNGGHLASMIAGNMNKSLNFARLIQYASELYEAQQRESGQDHSLEDLEELLKTLRDAVRQTPRG